VSEGECQLDVGCNFRHWRGFTLGFMTWDTLFSSLLLDKLKYKAGATISSDLGTHYDCDIPVKLGGLFVTCCFHPLLFSCAPLRE
jgi:hypothetical protein